jgi:hypothetical protein
MQPFVMKKQYVTGLYVVGYSLYRFDSLLIRTKPPVFRGIRPNHRSKAKPFGCKDTGKGNIAEGGAMELWSHIDMLENFLLASL